jgi:hypothetical protein
MNPIFPISYLMLGMALLAAPSAFGTSRLGSAEVRQVENAPCFSIPKGKHIQDKNFLLNSLTVYDATIKPPKEVWSFILPPETPHRMTPAACIPYGQAPVKSESIKAMPLVTGRIYEVYLNVTSSEPTDPTFAYEAKFCVVEPQKNGTTVHQIIFDKGWRYEPCVKKVTHSSESQ